MFLSARGIEALGAPPPFDYERSVPLLLKWLPLIDDPNVKGTIARSLCTKFARPVAVRPLLAEFRKAARESQMNLATDLVSDIDEVVDDSVFDELVPIATHRRYGFARTPIIDALPRLKDPRVVDVLTGLLEDEKVALHALMALRKLAPVEARCAIEPFADHSDKWMREEARAALKKIDTRRSAAP